MKKLNLDGLNVSQLSRCDTEKVNGGMRFIGGVIVGALISELIFDGVSKCWQDLKDGFNSVDYSNYY